MPVSHELGGPLEQTNIMFNSMSQILYHDEVNGARCTFISSGAIDAELASHDPATFHKEAVAKGVTEPLEASRGAAAFAGTHTSSSAQEVTLHKHNIRMRILQCIMRK